MKVHEGIDARLSRFLLDQPVFFVGTAPTSDEGHINVSPKGMRGTFAVFGEHEVGYLDYTGSGAETLAHLRENGRIVLMFCAFTGPPNIVRLHGRGRAVLPGSPGFGELLARFDTGEHQGLRAIIDVEVTRVSDSCGFSVPLLGYTEDRDLLLRRHSRRSDEDLAEYWATRNAHSIDGLPALDPPGPP
ncbi:pyridoxamine 5'-phosphate oxidase [Prauserella marina]|uniref:Pyridoxamine 5'-phosphate oxidase n=1 Tax=Prauserella marina TaxID=530584 RepID=A0A222VL18_9PSEU|nr:pyridoxamine 5'-phosphate oxidase family protein [Prauserella marina]ASR34620.1 pyridoxamine 5'-phosphate oxidase [Prauserella marina]PWV85744.1 pyridoxamine 5'-phosphate oxidase [Prauserella marina]SDC46707.1 Pyridoxamine 5'-phosphate oxidase [Prauserella marina]